MKKALDKTPKEAFVPPRPNDAEKSILRGVSQGAHTILQFVDKDDPQGQIPADPARDPFYESWEKAVQEWVIKQNLATPENAPTIAINAPANDAIVARGVPIPIKITANAKRGVRSVEYLINGTRVKTITASPFDFNDFSFPATFTPGAHTITVRAFDDVGNSAEISITLTVQ